MQIDKDTRLLVISPHPDDEALGCGGLIGNCLKQKGKLLIVYVSVGDSRQLVTGKTEKNKRQNEITAVENFLGVKTQTLFKGESFCRLDIMPQKEITEKIEDIIEGFKPTMITIPSSSSYNQDHRAVSDACITALRPVPKTIRHFPATILEYFEPYVWNSREPKQPNFYVDLSKSFKERTLLDFKIDLYKCHKTQVREDPFPRSIENIERLAHIYGKEIGVSLAEPFVLLRHAVW